MVKLCEWSDPRSNVHYLGSSENKAWKNSGLYGGYKVFDSFQKTKNRKNICSAIASELELMVTSLENLTS